MPCGACRQLLAEYAPDAKVYVADSRALNRLREFAVQDLLPEAFLVFAEIGIEKKIPHHRLEGGNVIIARVNEA